MNFVYEVVADYFDEEGVQVQKRKHTLGTQPENWTNWCSYAMLMLQTPVGPITKRFEIPLPGARNVEQAFDMIGDNVDAAKEKAVAEIEAQMQELAREQHGALWDPSKGPPPGMTAGAGPKGIVP